MFPTEGTEAFTSSYLSMLNGADRSLHSQQVWVAIMTAHLDLGSTRPSGVPLLAVKSMPEEAQRLSIDVVADDAPYLTDSLTAAITGIGGKIIVMVHPLFEVRRDRDSGTLEAFNEPKAGESGQLLRESWIHIEAEVPESTDPAELSDILTSTCSDVASVAQDTDAMNSRAAELSARLAVDLYADAEAAALLQWLAEDHFVFLGYRRYTPTASPDSQAEYSLVPEPDSGLGISATAVDAHSATARRVTASRGSLVVATADTIATVGRRSHMTLIAVQEHNSDSQFVAEHRFLGLFTPMAARTEVTRVPVVRRTVSQIVETLNLPASSHAERDLRQLLETFPRTELFQSPPALLVGVLRALIEIGERRRIRVFWRRADAGNYISCLVYLPRDRYTTQVRLGVSRLLKEALGAQEVEFSAYVSESVLARLYFTAWMPRGGPSQQDDLSYLNPDIENLIKTWQDHTEELVEQTMGSATLGKMRPYLRSFAEDYTSTVEPQQALGDIEILMRPFTDGISVRLEPDVPVPGRAMLSLYSLSTQVSLSRVQPLLANLGLRVVEETPYLLKMPNGNVWLYRFEVASGPNLATDFRYDDEQENLLYQAFHAIWAGKAESDRLNALTLSARLGWRQTAILRTYVRYLGQSGWTYSVQLVQHALLGYPDIAQRLVALFETKFDPDQPAAEPGELEALSSAITALIDEVPSLEHDTILRAMLGLINATVRTNVYQTPATEGHRDEQTDAPAMAIKLDPRRLTFLPNPHPLHEIWVYSPRVEGIHLRFGDVARGGLRWSDRREDLRTEVLSLAAAQQVKNAVIVPAGAKGGFVVRNPITGSRAEVIGQGKDCYKVFIRALLSLTDNRVGGSAVPPERTRRYDGDDTYLVVAADKGTATFSDTANAIAHEQGFWLGDAFASGGSAGYDHKELGITARGAWESVKQHFKELGHDVQNERTTVVGIGDMSGDVFGNGMLLSRHLALVAAFDHRHIFVDPHPDEASSFGERQRIFALPGSSWDDYDRALISDGGGVYPRTAKSVPVTPQARAALGIEGHVTELTPTEFIRAVLRAPVELLYNGGIGTYVRAASETDTQVGDKANDSVRILGSQIRARVVGEGGNLGFTQAGRIEAAESGVAINTDAMDNSAGVDSSDHEVNFKILLGRAVEEGSLSERQRDSLLAAHADAVCELVLTDNREQNELMSMSRWQATSMASVHRRFLSYLDGRGLDRAVDHLPNDAQMKQLVAAGKGLRSPELATLMARVKLFLKEDVLHSAVPDEPWGSAYLHSYFPHRMIEASGSALTSHALRREIITTQLVNELISACGITFCFQITEETGRSGAQVVAAYRAAAQVLDLPGLVALLRGAAEPSPANAVNQGTRLLQRMMDRTTRKILADSRGHVDVEATIQRYASYLHLRGRVREWIKGRELDVIQEHVEDLRREGLTEEAADRMGSLLNEYGLLQAIDVANDSGRDPLDTARCYYAMSGLLHVDDLLESISTLTGEELRTVKARHALRDDVYHALTEATRTVAIRAVNGDMEAAMEGWLADKSDAAQTAIDAIAEASDLAGMVVASRSLLALAR